MGGSPGLNKGSGAYFATFSYNRGAWIIGYARDTGSGKDAIFGSDVDHLKDRGYVNDVGGSLQ